jgi:hypothetical protein
MHFMGNFVEPEGLEMKFSITESLAASAPDDWSHSSV